MESAPQHDYDPHAEVERYHDSTYDLLDDALKDEVLFSPTFTSVETRSVGGRPVRRGDAIGLYVRGNAHPEARPDKELAMTARKLREGGWDVCVDAETGDGVLHAFRMVEW